MNRGDGDMEEWDVTEDAEREAREWDEDHGPVGIFPSWKALYTTVVVYAGLLIVIFYVLSVTLDYSGS